MTGALKVWNGTSWVYASIGTGSPVGSVIAFAGASAPVGWLICDGSTFSSTTYPLLAAVVGDLFGVHSGTTYYLPDLRKRVPVGKDTSDTDFNAIGKTGGEKNHTLTNAEMPTHSHGGGTGWVSNDHTHGLAGTNNFLRYTGAGGGNVNVSFGGNNSSSGQAASPTGGISANHWHGINNDGGGGAHNNMQPFIVMNYIICAQ
jgi:microcystin-dependent protein